MHASFLQLIVTTSIQKDMCRGEQVFETIIRHNLGKKRERERERVLQAMMSNGTIDFF